MSCVVAGSRVACPAGSEMGGGGMSYVMAGWGGPRVRILGRLASDKVDKGSAACPLHTA